eukprot:229026_1
MSFSQDPAEPCKGLLWLPDYGYRCVKLWWSDSKDPKPADLWVANNIGYIYTIPILKESPFDEAKAKICNKDNLFNYELPYRSIIINNGENSMSDLDKECMNKYHSHLASIHSAKQEDAARIQ